MNVIALVIMGIGLPVCIFLAGQFSDRVINRHHPAPMSDQAMGSGCAILAVVTAILWLGVCFPLMRLVLSVACGRSFGFD